MKNDLRYANKLRDFFPESKIIFCGADVLIRKERFLHENKNVDFTVIGEYEKAVLEICEVLRNGKKDFSGIKGVIYRNGEKIVKNDGYNLIDNLDEIPWPARDIFPMEKYIDAVAGLPLPSLQVWASRGCPFNCNFCLWPQIMYGGRNYRVRNAENVAEEIEYCVKRWGFNSFYFDDDTFNIGKERIIKLAREIKRRKIEKPFAVMARADTMDEEQIAELKEAGLYSLKYGVESGVQEIVNNCGKALDLKKVEEAVMLAKKYGIKVHLTFAFGLPGETKDTIKKTIDFACSLDPDSVQFSIITPFPGSRYYEELNSKGYIINKNWEDYTGYTKAVIRTENLTKKDLEDACVLAVREWRNHNYRKSKCFSPYELERFVKDKGSDRILLFYSSFREHIKDVKGVLEGKFLKIACMSNKREELGIFDRKKVILLEGNYFKEEDIRNILNSYRDFLFVIPVNNVAAKGYELFRDVLSESSVDFVFVDENGRIFKDFV